MMLMDGKNEKIIFSLKKGNELQMNDANEQPQLPTVKLNLNSTFKFACHKGLECFTKCCRGIKIILTPYDIIRLKNRLELSSDEFLSMYTELNLLEKTDLPVVTMRLMDDEKESCPFVRDDGCIIYTDRPTTCRYYPLGTGALSHSDEEADSDDFYFFIEEPHCKGFEEEDLWTVKAWREDQGVDEYDEINEAWTALVVKKRSFPPNIKLSENAKKLFFMASYNIDSFKRFVFDSEFLKLYHIDNEIVEKMKNDESELLKFGFKWLNWIIFKDGDFKINEAEVKARLKKNEK
ncbi:YkgJ family cysteine cluster protein [Candidatus Magnetomoraceae bacterium gMMP-15]